MPKNPPATVDTIFDLITHLSRSDRKKLCSKLDRLTGFREVSALPMLLEGERMKVEAYKAGSTARKDKGKKLEQLIQKYVSAGLTEPKRVHAKLRNDAPEVAMHHRKDRETGKPTKKLVSLKRIQNIMAKLKH